MKTALKYLKQKSTWQGIIGLVGVFGVAINPEQTEAIIGTGIGLISTIELFRNEDNK